VVQQPPSLEHLEQLEQLKVAFEAINHPAHYNAGIIEHCEMVEDQGHAAGYYFGQVTKYLFRAGRKPGTESIQDLQKAAWYMNRWVAWCQHGKKIWKIAKRTPEIDVK
jgi:hypothetical protein